MAREMGVDGWQGRESKFMLPDKAKLQHLQIDWKTGSLKQPELVQYTLF